MHLIRIIYWKTSQFQDQSLQLGTMHLDNVRNHITTIGEGWKLKDDIFESYSSLENITIPRSVTSNWNYPFKSCYALETVKIEERVKQLGIVHLIYVLH